MPKREALQHLSRLRVPQIRAAEILRILHESPPGLGDRVYNPRVYDRLVERRVMELDLNHDMTEGVDGPAKRPSYNGAALVLESVNILLAMGMVSRLSPGVYAITELGRQEARAWFPELAIADEQRTMAK